MSEEAFDYGRQKLRGRPITIKPAWIAGQACEKCRSLTIRNEHCVCGKGHALDAECCADFSDCSRERDFRPFFDYNLWMRR